MKKIGCQIVATFVFVALLILGAVFYYKYYYVLAIGVKEGQLNYVTYKGYVFKTYEGKIIQTGFKNGIQSNEFEFSIEDETLAKKLMTMGGKSLQLRYKEYNNPLPWRGYTAYVVDSIVSVVGEENQSRELLLPVMQDAEPAADTEDNNGPTELEDF